MNNKFIDNRTLAVNANSIEFLRNLGVWDDLKSKPQLIEKIVIDDNINKGSIIFENSEAMGNVIINKELLNLKEKS